MLITNFLVTESLPGYLSTPRRPHPKGQGPEEAAIRPCQVARVARRRQRQGHDCHHRCYRRGRRAPRGLRAPSSRVRLSVRRIFGGFKKNKTLCTDLFSVNKNRKKLSFH